ncbi:O-antigen polymerase [Enterococcus faecium]|uniref:O-antigen polymerase n=1 Tax=Enterococcus TaxID=1350 RepID=UPI001432EEE5|nr:O-antigen polymerase [Enterococcus faecium]MCM6897607.1 oligosaccharide repeat unit polymerase [Enterococcus faecium]MCM6907337.1 oligosaccharide repeat unit polymerase [Enterococcus faecium]MCM6925959.1 oligosaccharide repeat unit polymerase [Enterococcus faecium]MCM6937164.1 oligosaccharide repeat unit polymerase [Enterococcus faecium]
MNDYIFLLGCILLLIMSFQVTKDIISPEVLFPIPWIIATIILITGDFSYNPQSMAFFYLLIGAVIFEIGCFIGHNKINSKERIITKKQNKAFRPTVLFILMMLEIIFICFVLYTYILYTRNNFNVNIFTTLYSNKENMFGSGVIGYGRNLISAFSIAIIVGYGIIEEDKKNQYRKILMVQIAIALINGILGVTRNGILSALLPLAFACIVVFNINSKKAFKTLFVSFLFFLSIFLIVSMQKYWYTINDESVISIQLSKQIQLYASGSLAAFQKIFDTKIYTLLYGENTFRFFIAIFDVIFGVNKSSSLVQDFINIGNTSINVYTFYQYYLYDFGPIYALIVQFIIGTLHGVSFKNMSMKKPFWIFLYSILIYPLLMQFFQDQYFSIFSTWMQLIIVGFLTLKTDLLFYVKIKK